METLIPSGLGSLADTRKRLSRAETLTSNARRRVGQT
jgi:hypothetical protein